MSEITCDDFYEGRVKVYQPAQGFRAGTDSLLLAAALDGTSRGRALEIGCGAGGALLPAAYRLSDLHFTGLERDPDMAALDVLATVLGDGRSSRLHREVSPCRQ